MRSLWLTLAIGVALPRWLYLATQWSEAPSLRALAWAADVVCLTAAAVALFRLQRAARDDESKVPSWIAMAGLLLDAATTFIAPWMKVPDLAIFIAVGGWTYGICRWLEWRCAAAGTPYFVFRVALATIVLSYVAELLHPDFAFPTALIIDSGIAVQCVFIWRTFAKSGSPAP